MTSASVASNDHLHYLRLSLACARQSPPKPTNFCVGGCLVSPSSDATPLVTGYTLECEGNTHAEQCCFIKLSQRYQCAETSLGEFLPDDTTLYTTMEPCNKRSVGNKPCVDRILELKRKDGSQAITKVVVGVIEPETFVGVNNGRAKLEAAGIEVVHVGGLEEEILAVATAGHENDTTPIVDVEKQCSVVLPQGGHCTRGLTCKRHSMSAKRAVPGRSAPYDTLLMEYQNQVRLQRAEETLG